MRAFFTGLFLFAVAVALALAARFDPGNVVFFFPPYRVDLSLNLFLLLAVLVFFMLYGLVRLASKTVNMPQRVAEYRRRQLERRSYKALRSALQSHFEGRYGHAESQAQLAQELPETAGLAALIAARAAHRMNEFTRRDNWLKSAEAQADLRAARLMTEAECLIDARDARRALAVVNQLHTAGARHIQSLRLALKANQYAGEWQEVLRLQRTLNKRDAIHPAAMRQIKSQSYNALFKAREGDGYALINFWQSVPTGDRRIPEVALAAARAFNAAQLGYQARVVLEGALASEWDERLVMEYAQCREENSQPQIEQAERWLNRHPSDVHLQYVLGVLCARQQLWGKAQSFLQTALKGDGALARPAHLELARLYEEIEDAGQAAQHYRLAALD
jgi:HemY protein